jgi:hypothetical protein
METDMTQKVFKRSRRCHQRLTIVVMKNAATTRVKEPKTIWWIFMALTAFAVQFSVDTVG